MSEELKKQIIELLKDKDFVKALADALSEYLAKKEEVSSLRDDLDDALYEIREELERLKKGEK